MNKKNIEKLIFILILLFIFIISVIVYKLQLKSNSKNLEDDDSTTIINNSIDKNIPDEIEEKEDIWEESEEEKNKEKKLESKNDKYTYFLIKQCLHNYYNTNLINKGINIIDTEAIEKLSLNEKNISNIFVNFNNIKFNIDDIYMQSIDGSKKIYVVYHRLTKDSVLEDSVVFVKIDEKNVDFSIYPYEYLKRFNYLNVKQGDKIDISNLEEVAQNEYNHYSTNEISKENKVCMAELFEKFKFDLNYDIEHLYNTIDEDYKKIYFENFQEFKKYLEKKFEIINNDELIKFQVKQYGNYIQYIGICANDNHYIFYAKDLMNYTICLDNYSTELPQYLMLYYANLPDNQGKYCIDRFMKAINDKNYEFAYSKLLYVQKNNYYQNIEIFENFIKNNFYEKNNWTFENVEKISNQMYQYTIKIQNSDNTEYKILVATITLKEKADFYISLVIK